MPTLAVSDSESDGEMPTLDELFKAKKTAGIQQQSSFLKNELSSSQSDAQKTTGAKANVGASKVSGYVIVIEFWMVKGLRGRKERRGKEGRASSTRFRQRRAHVRAFLDYLIGFGALIDQNIDD